MYSWKFEFKALYIGLNFSLNLIKILELSLIKDNLIFFVFIISLLRYNTKFAVAFTSSKALCAGKCSPGNNFS